MPPAPASLHDGQRVSRSRGSDGIFSFLGGNRQIGELLGKWLSHDKPPCTEFVTSVNHSKLLALGAFKRHGTLTSKLAADVGDRWEGTQCRIVELVVGRAS